MVNWVLKPSCLAEGVDFYGVETPVRTVNRNVPAFFSSIHGSSSWLQGRASCGQLEGCGGLEKFPLHHRLVERFSFYFALLNYTNFEVSVSESGNIIRAKIILKLKWILILKDSPKSDFAFNICVFRRGSFSAAEISNFSFLLTNWMFAALSIECFWLLHVRVMANVSQKFRSRLAKLMYLEVNLTSMIFHFFAIPALRSLLPSTAFRNHNL